MGDKIFFGSKVSEIVTERILEQLERGIVPWHKSWKNAKPRNWETKREYNGVNLFLLEPGEYLTFNQIKKLGAKLKKGAKGSIVVFWKAETVSVMDEKKTTAETTTEGEEVIETVEEQEKEKVKTVYLLKYYYVFNVRDVEGLPERKTDKHTTLEEITYDERVRQALKLVKEWNNIVLIKHGNYEPCYSPTNDVIYMPRFSNFQGNNRIEEYFSTLFHEIVHSTGHKDRLNRIRHNKYGDWHYAQEELVAELGSAFLLNIYGLDVPATFKNNAAYINYWWEQLQRDKTMIVKAAGKAERAVEYIFKAISTKQNLYEVQQATA